MDTFKEQVKTLDEWRSGDEDFRLVDLGAGPTQLQIKQSGAWIKEKDHYSWGVLISRIKFLKENRK